jgi:hypothetical protein
MTRAERRTHWHTIIEDQATSGISAAAYCREGQIHPSLFYSWRRRFQDQQPCAGGFLELMPDRLTEPSTSGVRLRLGGKLHVEVDRGFDPFTLRAVVETLGGLS